MKADLVITLRGGTYRLPAPLTFGPGSSGENGYKLVLRSYTGEHAVISGGRPITGWTLYDGARNIYRAPIQGGWNFRQLYVNGRQATRARVIVDRTTLHRVASGFRATSLPPAWGDITGSEVVIFGKWMVIRCRVASVSGDLVTMTQPCWKNSDWALRWGAILPTWIENKHQFLRDPGDWYLDRGADSFVYYMPRPGEDMAAAEVIAPFLTDLIIGQDAHDITFEDLRFTASNWVAPDGDDGYVGLQAGYHKVGEAGALVPMHAPIRFSGSRNISLSHNVFEQLGSTAIAFDAGSQNISVTGNEFAGLAGGAMRFGGIADAGNTARATQSRSYVVRENVIRAIGCDYFDNAAIAAFYVADLVAEYNRIGPVPHYGISVGWGWGKERSYLRGNLIGWNYIHDFSELFSDSAGIYTLGGSPGTVVHDNYVSGGGRGFGCLYPDEGSAYQRWTRNVCENVRQWLRIWTDSIQDNQIDGNWTDTAALENKGHNNDIFGNTVVADRRWPQAAQAVKTQSQSASASDASGLSNGRRCPPLPNALDRPEHN